MAGAGQRRTWLVGAGTLLAGAAIIALAIGFGPRPLQPLYDGIVPVEAYRWVEPPPGEHGGAEGASATLPTSGGSNPLIALSTPELTPQAEIFAVPGGLTLPAGTTSLVVSITPLPPDVQPSSGHIAGNVYRITILNQAGATASAPAASQVSIVLRAPDQATTDATMERFDGTAWQPLDTSDAGLAATFIAIGTDFGDFALVVPGPPAATSPPSEGPSTTVIPVQTPGGTAPPGGGSGLPNLFGLPLPAVGAVVIVILLVVSLLRPQRRGGTSRDRRRRGPR
jgi:hypothetical protein